MWSTCTHVHVLIHCRLEKGKNWGKDIQNGDIHVHVVHVLDNASSNDKQMDLYKWTDGWILETQTNWWTNGWWKN